MGIPCVLRPGGATPCAWLLLLMVVATKYEPGAKEFHQTLLPREPGGPGLRELAFGAMTVFAVVLGHAREW